MSLLKEKNLLLLGVVLLAAVSVAIVVSGRGFLFVPIAMIGGLYLVISKIFDIFSGLHVVRAHMWADLRKKPTREQLLQILALVIATIIVVAVFALSPTAVG